MNKNIIKTKQQHFAFWISTKQYLSQNLAAFVCTIALTLASAMLYAQNAQVSTFSGSAWPSAEDGPGTEATFYSPSGIVLDADGNTYVADAWNNRIRKITSAGVVTTLAGSTMGDVDGIGTEAKFNNPTGVAIDESGNLYVADYYNNRIRKIVISTGEVTTLAGSTQGNIDGIGTEAKFYTPSGVAVSEGNLYVADYNNSRIRKIVISTAEVTTLAGSTHGFANGIGIAAKFLGPNGIAADTHGNLYVADVYNDRIRKIVISTGEVTTLAGSSTWGDADGIGIAAKFNHPNRVVVSGGKLYVADGGNNRIRMIAINTAEVTTLAGSTEGYADGIGTAAKFNRPQGVAVSEGNLYIADQYNHRIRKIVIRTAEVSTLAGGGSNYWYIDGIGTKATFKNLQQVAVDTDENLYVADTWNHSIRKITSAGEVSTLAGSGDADYAEGIGTEAKFNYPSGVVVSGGNLYVADRDNNRIRKIVISTGVVTTLAGSTWGYADGIGTAAKFASPQGIAISEGNLYVVDTQNDRIRKILISTGEVTTLAGSDYGYVNGIGTEAKFKGPTGIAVDASGYIYIADHSNNLIRKIVISTGEVTTLAGSGDADYANGIGAAAKFNRPKGVAVSEGNLYVADEYNHRIRKIVISTSEVTTLAGSTEGYVDGIAAASKFKYPTGIAVDASGYIYIADRGNNLIRKIMSCPIITLLSTNDQNHCTGASVADLTATASTGETVIWYATETGGTALADTDLLTSADYYAEAKNIASGCISSSRVKVTVTLNTLPTVSAGDDQTICAGAAVLLTATGASTLNWDNDVINATAFVPTATTTYTVTGIDANGCSASDEVIITVNPLPTVSAGDDQTICAGAAITLSATGASTLTWDNDVVNTTAFVPTATTTYTVTGIDANGCSATDEVTITVNPIPTVSAGDDQTICAGTAVLLTATGASTLNWDNDVVNATAFVPTATTTYTVTGINANGCSATDEVTITVNPIPTVSAGDDQTICAGTAVLLTATGTATLNWDNDVVNATAFVPTATTTYTVTGIDANGCSATDEVIITVTPLPTVSAGDDQTICAGAAVLLTATGASTLNWDNDVVNATAFVPTATTTYTVTGINANGCSATDEVTVTVNPVPTVSAGDDQTICAGTAVLLTATGASTLNWDNSVINASAFVPAATTTYTVTGIDANGCSATEEVTVTVTPLSITPTISQTLNVLTATTSTTGVTYQWLKDCNATAALISEETSATYTVSESGSYAVKVSKDGCEVVSECQTIVFTGMEELEAMGVSFYPNPVNKALIIDKSTQSNLYIRLLDNSGKELSAQQATEQRTTLDMSSYSPGVYYISLTANDKTVTQRIVKK